MTNLNIQNLPKSPGVYIFRDVKNKVLYVGKAISLRDRVTSYFQKTFDLGPKTSALVSKIKKIDHILVNSELEALLLEAELVKRYKPPYNINLKDDKSYKFIKITRHCDRQNDFPAVFTTHTEDCQNSDCFGPFPEGQTVRYVLKELRRIFKFRDCSVTKYDRYQKLQRPCLFGNINLCSAPCVGNISKDDYQRDIKRLVKFLTSRQKDPIIKELKREMVKLSRQNEYERAGVIRDQITRFEYITQKFVPASEFLDNPNFVSDERLKSQKELFDLLSISPIVGQTARIECFDVSHFAGQFIVGSMAVFVDGAPSKKDYRRFKIKGNFGNNDVAGLSEIISRRLRHEGWPLPKILIVDGGKPQVFTIKKILKKLGFDNQITLIGLAKRYEEVVTSSGTVIRLSKSSPALRLLEQLRDEAHRFANRYRLSRSKLT